MSPAAGVRLLAVAAVVAGLGLLAGEQGFWVCVPGALLLMGAEPTPRRGVAGAGLLVAFAALALRPPAPALALLVAAAAIGVLAAVRVRLERERDAMRRFALRDPLTGLANRRALDDRLAYEIARHRRHDATFVVLALDLDGFKAVNDRFGHDAGDEVLRDAAAALLEAVRGQDTVVRLGGDEFCVLAPQTDRDSAAHLAARVLTALAGVTTGIRGLSASVGAAVFPDDAQTPEALLAAADAAALAVKRRSRAARPRSRAA